MGFNYLFFAREDFADKSERKLNKEMEFIWTPKFED
jgi:hypothetical protein